MNGANCAGQIVLVRVARRFVMQFAPKLGKN
jgi:hypothetical protein